MGNTSYFKTFSEGDAVIYNDEKYGEIYGVIKTISTNSDGQIEICIDVSKLSLILAFKDYPPTVTVVSSDDAPGDLLYYPAKKRYYVGEPVTAVAKEFGGTKANCIVSYIYREGMLTEYTVYCIDKKSEYYCMIATVGKDRLSAVPYYEYD